MDKLIKLNRAITITNDGATVLDMLDIIHPAAKTMVDIAKSQDDEVGDGTTSVVLLAGALLKEAKEFIEGGLPSQKIIKGYRYALNHALECLETLSEKINIQDKKYFTLFF